MALPSFAQPALWLISRGGTKVYLFANVDSVPPETNWATDKITKAFEDSDEIWFEHPLLAPAALYAEVKKVGSSNSVEATSTLIDGDQFAKIEGAVRASSLPHDAMDDLPPWALATMIQMDFIARSGQGPDAVDARILNWTQKRSKKVHYFNQVNYLWSGLAEQSSEYQLLMLFETADAQPNFASQQQEAFDAWIRGDLTLMAKAARNSLNWNLPLYKQIVLDQNARYEDYIRRLLDGEGTQFVSLGYKQVIGAGGVLKRLTDDGIIIDRLQ
ncbi:TraB/GumN family protein [Oryzibacter oryziterrae]|uniref:TraB/GumN family protein n=1 Tax=Oryzibacter oryziterrae TaxID=2766474 RepID=UPI001F344168|nr:TraB/GumN family protein [Oryzibacter oryziterrae]